MKKLTVMSLNALKAEGLHSEPECRGLYIQVSYKRHGTEYSVENGVTKSWVYRSVTNHWQVALHGFGRLLA